MAVVFAAFLVPVKFDRVTGVVELTPNRWCQPLSQLFTVTAKIPLSRANAVDLVLQVPAGTLVTDEAGRILADLAAPGDRVVVQREEPQLWLRTDVCWSAGATATPEPGMRS